ncbi:MAG: flippase-like domain-containing protein [Candidatus Zixiibacteriota bacterium]|nr:MAG: flippase-like domain-containing protein [candidate division Zixibacteria bacterium]
MIGPKFSLKARSVLVQILKYLLIAVVVYFAGKKLVDNWTEVAAYQWRLNPLFLLLSVAGHLVTFLLLSKVWCFLISGFGYRVSLPHAFKISYIANLGRYIPGKIWPVFGMVYLARKIEVSEEAAVTSWGLAQMFAIPASFLVCLIAVVINPQLLSSEVSRALSVGIYVAGAVVFVLSLVMIVAPAKMLYLFNCLLRMLGRPEISFRLSPAVAVKIYLGYFVCWALFGFSFWLFLLSISGDMFVPVIAAAGAFVIAYQIGYLTIFSPGGLGVRELVLTSVLTAYLGPVAAGVAVACRLWNMVSEIIAALIALKIRLVSGSGGGNTTGD